MIRLFIPHDLSPGAELALDHGQSHYLASVMRQGVGDEVLLFNGRDGEWRATITVVTKRAVGLRAEALARPQAKGPDLDLVIALVKRSRLETIVEKAAELGARRVLPVVTERTNADRARVERLTAIATEAAEQTGRLDVPEVLEPVKLRKLIEAWEPGRKLLFCDEAGDALSILQALTPPPRGEGVGGGGARSEGAGKPGADTPTPNPSPQGGGDPWAILIGPEGGFSPAERATLRALPYAVPASLGPRILRADTAAISALTLWQSALGDWTDPETA
ncbi:16S rRNA (uracil(1498)-N(3))-methyltransferase [Phenylobacterium sp.]|uniref:16S rRNA (uracil(1498)-N(3))-methyltransferase n=1 Tax=Phenylobacterium sp. TaxID=1871053 RepID=UPI002C9D2630|nr:16S rRNA (uracil(1498)-N(3))-methyltransferase [Phenylobacterium sp.]HLZ75056.1 16S rRNA (uracil(1498)-N(3))-methyltransferase [Phenylobacterium sp.]